MSSDTASRLQTFHWKGFHGLLEITGIELVVVRVIMLIKVHGID